jgi:hypothetical protein
MAKCHYICKQKANSLSKTSIRKMKNKQVITKNTILSENTTIRAGPIVLNDTSYSTAHEAGKEAPLWADKQKKSISI